MKRVVYQTWFYLSSVFKGNNRVFLLAIYGHRSFMTLAIGPSLKSFSAHFFPWKPDALTCVLGAGPSFPITVSVCVPVVQSVSFQK